jgi:hypothetical protein
MIGSCQFTVLAGLSILSIHVASLLISACQILAMHELVREGNVTTVSCLETQKSSLDRDKEESIIA